MPRVSPDRDDEYLEDDAEERRSKPGALSAGWLRALLVLSALAVVLVITVPHDTTLALSFSHSFS